MQSYLQYRRIGQAVRKQLSEHPEWTLNAQQRRNDLTTSIQNNEVADDKPSRLRPLSLPPGVKQKEIIDASGVSSTILVVGWESHHDPANPHNYSLATRITATLIVSALGFAVGAASSIESAVLPQNSAAFGVSEVVASLATGIYLLGFAAGSLVSGPLSEIVGRNAVYLASLTLFMIFVMASGLAPNIGAQLAFRFLAGVFGCPPLTCAGGTIADLWNPLEKTLTFPLYAITSFGGPVLGPLIASYMGQGTLSWRWTNWIMLIMSGLVMALIVLLQPETYGPLLLKWKAKHYRKLTGDHRYRSEMDMQKIALFSRITNACTRQFTLTVHEPIILFIALYMTVIYIVLFTFFDGYPFIFEEVYGVSQGITNVIWIAMYVGIALASLWVPVVYSWTKKEFAAVSASPMTEGSSEGNATETESSSPDDESTRKSHPTRPENRLWFAMLGAPLIPIGLFWMGWTDYVRTNPPTSIVFAHTNQPLAEINLNLVPHYRLRHLRLRNHHRLHIELHVRHRFIRHVCCICTGVYDGLTVLCSWGNDCCRDSVLLEHGRSLHVDDSGMHQCGNDAAAVCVLEVWAYYQGLV
jgi:MFS family permease